MLSCEQLAHIITDYLENEMSWWQRMRFRLHIGMCKDCWAYVDQVQKTVDSLCLLPPGAPERAVEEKLLHRFRNWNG